MRQVTKFYLTSFLKNQTYFTPILILFLQAATLNYLEIFWVFTIGSITSLIIEIPTGIIADLFGKRRSIIISKFGIFISFFVYGLSSTFWMFVLAQVLYQLGNSFRSGTETAYTYDFLLQNKNNPSYTEVKGKQKFYARIGEAIATSLGSVIAVGFGYNWVFFIAAIPAFLNFILALFWEEINEKKGEGVTFKASFVLVKNSFFEIFKKSSLLRITFNIMVFTSVLAALEKFIQPYMIDAKIPIAFFGLIYSGSLLITALAVRYSYVFQNRFGLKRTINWLTFFAAIPVLILGFRFISIIGVILFFTVTIIENIRSPIANNQFHLNATSKRRATEGSILALSKSLGQVIILPITGFLAHIFSIYTAILILGGFLLINSVLFSVKKPVKKVNF